MDIGPVEYVLISFPGNQFKGEIVPALSKLIESGTVRILDLAFIMKDGNGDTLIFEFDQLEELAPFADLDGEAGGLIGTEDLEYAAAALEPNSSAALIIWEDTWAAEFASAVRGAGGVMLEGARISHELVELAFAEADSLAAADG